MFFLGNSKIYIDYLHSDKNMAKEINNIVELDVKDKKILYNLDFDARIPLSQLAKKVGLSEEVVGYRIKNLMRLKIIEKFYPAKDLMKLGYNYIKFLIRLRKTSSDIEKKLIDEIKNNKSIGWLLVGDGMCDITAGFFVKDMKELEKLFFGIVYKYGEMFLDVRTSIGVRIFHYKHNYIYGTKDYNALIVGENPKQEKIDEIDNKILDLLDKDGRMPITIIAKSLNLSLNAVKYRIKRLEKEKIILGYRCKLNIRRLGYEHRKVYTFFNKVDEKKLNEIITYLRYHPQVIYTTQSIGMSILEFEVIIKNRSELYELLDNLKDRFPGTFFDFGTVLHYGELAVT